MPNHHHPIRVVLMLTLTLAFATLAAAQTGLSVPSHGFQLQVPAGWDVEEDDSDDVYALFFVMSPSDAGGLIVAAGPLDGAEGAAYRDAGLAGLTDLSFALVAELPGAQRGELTPTRVAGVEAATYAYSAAELGGRFVYFVAGELVYAIGTIADAEAAPAVEAALELALASFQLVPMGTAPIAGAAEVADPIAGDPFVGTFAGDGLTLQLEPSGGGYVGRLTFSGQTYPVQARAAGSTRLTGEFASGGSSFAFDLVLDGDVRTLTTGSSRYELR